MSIAFRILIVCIMVISTQLRAESIFNFDASTPEGSWVVREETTTDKKGRLTVTITRQKNLGSERRDGQDYFWLETEIDSYTVKKGKRKPEGEHMVMKVLVSEEVMNSDTVNAINHLRGFGKEIIMQTGDSQPMLISEGGMMADAMMKSMGIEVNYQFTVEGTETIETAAGSFNTRRLAGTGSSSGKIMFKKIEMESKSLMWISDRVPFGIVRGESTSIINGDEQTSKTILLEYGNSGARTAITGEPMKMPF